MRSDGANVAVVSGYRDWSGRLRPTWWACWPIAWTGVQLVLRRKLFWLLLGLALLDFLFFFASIYLKAQVSVENPMVARFVDQILSSVTGAGKTYRDFMFTQGTVTMLVLAFAGELLIGSDYERGGLTFYLSRAVGRRHYVVGKLLAIGLHDALSGELRVLVSAARLVPPGASAPLAIDDYAFSDDESLVLIYTNSKRVWRTNSRGDYWILDLASHELRKLGGEAAPATLMFAKISPTARHVAYVRENNLYVEDLVTRQITALTTCGNHHIINGTVDWVYEEELGLRDGFAWSPDATAIAYWQIDTTGVPEFTLVNNTDGLYPQLNQFAYPKVGQQNSACRVGIVAANGGPTRWLDVPGDPREHYIARLTWAPDSRHVLLQQLNRRQNINRVLLADAGSGQVTLGLTEQDDAWIDVNDEFHWLDEGRRFTWISDRDGWRHVYLATLPGGDVKLVTPGNYDVVQLLHVDEQDQALYFQASPDNPTQRYLYRIGMDGTKFERLTPTDQSGWHHYQISPNGRWAIHQRSAADSPPVTELVALPQHTTHRVLADNAELRKRFEALKIAPPRVLPCRDRTGRCAGRLVPETVGFRAGQEVSVAGVCVRRAGRTDRGRSLVRTQLVVALDVNTTRLCRDQLR
jgi:dipeptidyl aminopeptidase/acylaminoacyl peptidase